MRLLSCLIVALAMALAGSAEAKGKAKGKGGKPAIEKKIKKDKIKKVAAPKGKGKAKGKGKGLDKGTPDEAKEVKEEAAAAEPGATEEAKPEPKGHAWGRDKKLLELRKHLERLAKLKRLEQIATEKKNDALLTKVQAMRTRENERHGRVLAKVDAKESIKDAKEAVKDAKEAVKEAKKAD